MHSRHLIEASGCLPAFLLSTFWKRLLLRRDVTLNSLVHMHHCFYLPLRMELNPFELSDKAWN